jgi:hypothetical protein
MLRDGKDIELTAGQSVTLVGVGDSYTTWEVSPCLAASMSIAGLNV